MGFIEGILERTASLQKRHALSLFIATALLTLILGIGIKDVRLQTDLSKEMPQDLPIFKLNDRISDTFGGQDTVILLYRLDESSDKRSIDDIRDPAVMESMMQLEALLEKESLVDSVTSPATYLRGRGFEDKQDIMQIISSSPSAKMLFSSDYKSAIMYIRADVGDSEEKIKSLARLVEENLETVPGVPGVRITLTGNPPLRSIIGQLLSHDAVFTLSLAGMIILIMLFITERSITKGLLVFAPLSIGLIWTLGALGWLGIPLSIATAGLGAMVLGLGVEYGVFMLSRYKEEREKGKSQEEALRTAVPSVGGAVFGSGMTTIIGFLALTLSSLPMMQKLGLSLAIGISCTLISAILVAPVLILLEEDLEYWHTHRKHRELTMLKEKHARNQR